MADLLAILLAVSIDVSTSPGAGVVSLAYEIATELQAGYTLDTEARV